MEEKHQGVGSVALWEAGVDGGVRRRLAVVPMSSRPGTSASETEMKTAIVLEVQRKQCSLDQRDLLDSRALDSVQRPDACLQQRASDE